MKDSILKGTGNSRFLKSAVPAGTSWADALAMLQAGTFPIDFNGINTEGFQQVGTPLNKANLLKDATSNIVNLPASATPDEMFSVLARLTGVTYVFAGNGVTVTATNGDTVKAVATNSDGIAEIYGLGYGDWELSATISGNKKTKTIRIDVLGMRYISLLSLNEMSWAQINNLCTSGVISKVFALGDTKDVALSGIGTMTLQIADFDHDYLSGSTAASKAPVTFLCKNLLYSTYQMNSSNTNSGGFMSSALKSTLNSTILNALPSDLRGIIKTCYKWYGTGNTTSNGAWGGCKIWLPLEYEMFGANTYAPTTERTTGNARQYPIFTDNVSRIKRTNNGAGSASYYWLASPSASNSNNFCCVHSGGTPNGNPAHFSAGVCFGLCV